MSENIEVEIKKPERRNERIEPQNDVTRRTPLKRSLGLWILSTFLAVVFMLSGAMKIGGTDTMVGMFENWGYPLWFMTGVGAFEVLCGILLLFPRATFAGSTALLFLMMGAMGTHVLAAEYAFTAVPLVLAGLLGINAYFHRPRIAVHERARFETLH